MAIVATANGIDSFVTMGKQTGIGVKAATNSGKLMRRSEALFQTEADSYQSNEIRTSQQQNDTRLGNFRSSGSIKCPMSASSFTDVLAAALRKAFAAVGATVTANDIAAVADGFTTVAGDFIADGFKFGMIVRPSGFTTTGAANNGANFFVYEVTGPKLFAVPLNGDAVALKAAGDNVTIEAPGMWSYVPASGHTKDYFTVEVSDPDIAVHRTFLDQLVDTVSLNVPPNGMSEFSATFKGLNEDAPTAVAYFVSPAPQTGTRNFSGSTALLAVAKEITVACTGMNFQLAANVIQDPAIGTKFVAAVSRGKVMGSGQFTVFFQDTAYLDYFREETEIPVAYALAADSSPDADAMAFSMPRILLKTATVNDGEINKIVTCDFDMLENTDGTGDLAESTIFVQDTTL